MFAFIQYRQRFGIRQSLQNMSILKVIKLRIQSFFVFSQLIFYMNRHYSYNEERNTYEKGRGNGSKTNGVCE